MERENSAEQPPPPEVLMIRPRGPKVLSTKIDSEEPEPEPEPEQKPKIKGKKPILIGLFFTAIIVLAGAGLYYYVIPRVDVELVTVYHEGTGGVSSGGFINVNTQIKNLGTRDLEDINITLKITETGSGLLAGVISKSYYNLNRGDKEEPKVHFVGDHYKAYTIEVQLSFQAAGSSYFKTYQYDIGEDDAMNLIFEEKIFDWKL